jgi:uncharacterized protein (TIGR02646 family)
MRPIRRDASPRAADYLDYAEAKVELVARLGPYCSYCERRVATQLSVEHIQPKALAAYANLAGRWENFLLACVNCNSTKSDKDVVLADVLLPDRDNTFAAFEYARDGTVAPSAMANLVGLQAVANSTLCLAGLEKAAMTTLDANGRQVALDRVSQRKEVWLEAESARDDVAAKPWDITLREYVVKLAVTTGFFSVWMTVFSDDPDMRIYLINAFPGTAGSGCFDPLNSAVNAPAPNPDNLPNGCKL